jgi:hypothetical protein
MPDDEKQEKEPDQVVQQTADALFDGLLAFGEGMLLLGETIERLGVSLANKLLAHKCTEDCAGKEDAHRRLKAEAGEFLESRKALEDDLT